MTDTVSNPGPETTTEADEQLTWSPEHVRQFADKVAPGWRVAHKPEGQGSFGNRIEATATALNKLYVILDARPQPTYLPGEVLDPLLELRQNPRLLRAVITEIVSVRKKLNRLPRTVRDHENDEPRIVTAADAYLQSMGSVYHPHALKLFINEAQKYDALELDELWALSSVLQFLLLEEIITQANEILKDEGAHTEAGADLLKARMRSLRDIGYADWFSLIEPMVIFDPLLQQDPANAYKFMDFESREAYRKRVALIARYSDCTEMEVAQAALTLAEESKTTQRVEDPRLRTRRAHVGYYLIDNGFPILRKRVGYRPRFIDRVRLTLWHNNEDFYIGGIQVLSVILIGLIIAPLVPTYAIFGGLTLAFLLLLVPATQGAVDLINNTVTAIFKAYALPKLDFSKTGVPLPFTTLVAVPTLLINEKQIRELFDELEVRFLANQDRNIHFGLLTDLPDSVTRPQQNDTDPLVELAIQLTDELNDRYANAGGGSFFLLHRHRIFNARQGVWMGWERKRGKLLDLNKLLTGQFDAFPVKAGNIPALSQAQYVITLDSDTQLPRGTAHTMIGAMAHPLNRAIIDPNLRVVTEGYGILQPRVGVSVQSASRSRLAAVYSGQTGFDIYTRAISDAYQDLFGEGIFTGKGIYEINALQSVLDRRFPRNSLLSHDLIEGSYARVGLTTDCEVIDDYPSHYSAYTRRKHRWLRGDWQIFQWLFSKVPDESGKYVRNPISTISRWKIFDNLRRSLVEVLTFALLLAGWLGLPGGALYWTLVTLFLMFVPTMVQLVFSIGRAYATKLPGAMRDAFSGFGQGCFISLLNLVFLPHQTLLALDAIIRSLVRSFITGQRLLEWETAAESESATRRTPVDRYLTWSPLVALVVAGLVFLHHRPSLMVAAPIIILWAAEGAITAWLNSSPQQVKPKLTIEEDTFLRQLALKTWRFFLQYGGESHNYLIPDNVEENELFEAARVSPTNVGLLLNARQAAHTFGYLTIPEFVVLTERSLQTYEKLEKYRGHIFNWYDTRTLKPIAPMTISSVDSGNLAASFYTLRSGCRSLLRAALLDRALFSGIRDQWQLAASFPEAPAGLKAIAPPAIDAPVETWVSWALATVDSPEFTSQPETTEAGWWLRELQQRVRALNTVVRDYMPWLLPQFSSLFALPSLQGFKETAATIVVGSAAGFANDLDGRLARAATADNPEAATAQELRSKLTSAREALKTLNREVQDLANESMRVATEMDFGFLMDKSRLLLSIGYEMERHHLHQACYDLLSSEARIAAFITVSKGEAPQQSWFKLGRTHAMAYGRPVLISWTATMFEYLMPSLWMRSYPDTLMSRTLAGVVEIQRAFGREHGIPWGISESGWAGIDDHGHYHYQAFGIPQIALKWDAVAGPVISPYSTCLALGIDPVEAMRNMKRMAKMGWMGALGFYEAADYQESLKTPKLVREWMAHHQGMALLAILNLLHDNIVQDWFHANPHLEATQLLLHEKPIHPAALRAEFAAAKKAS